LVIGVFTLSSSLIILTSLIQAIKNILHELERASTFKLKAIINSVNITAEREYISLIKTL